MPKVAILTPDPADEAWQGRWPDVFEREAEPLRRAGIEVAGPSWAAPQALAGFDLVLPLLVWGYHRAGPSWIERIAAWQREGVRLMNPASVLEWNADKLYLGLLAERGAPVVPTRFVDRADEAALAAAAEVLGTDRLVAKPRSSATAWRTIRWSPGERVVEGPEGAAIVQPYRSSIETAGEVSLIYFAGRFSHAVRKVPQAGEFRVQPEYRGVVTAHEPDSDEHEAGEAILAAARDELLYARIDLVRGDCGRPELIELELIEPDLFLGYDPRGGAAFVEAVLSAIG